VYEETGFDISSFIVESDFVETVQSQQRTKLFIVTDIDEQVPCSALLCPSHSHGLMLCQHTHADDVSVSHPSDGVCAANAQGDQQHRMALG
jgi:hypothetical protein